MGVEWADSADRHGVPREDTLFAMLNAVGREEVEPRFQGETVIAYVGPPHEGALRNIEVLAAHREPNTIVIFHAMELTDNFRHLAREEWT